VSKPTPAGWVCEHCLRRHRRRKQAAACHAGLSLAPLREWLCADCEGSHEDREAAEECARYARRRKGA